MASFDDDDGGWNPRKFWIGRGLNWLATVVATLMMVFIIGDLAISWGQGQPILRVFALLIALLVWLILARSLALAEPLPISHQFVPLRSISRSASTVVGNRVRESLGGRILQAWAGRY